MSRYDTLGDGRPNIRELMKREVYADRDQSCISLFSEKYLPSDVFAVLDSWLLSQAPSWREGRYPFTFMPQGVSGDGNVGLAEPANRVTAIQVLDGVIPLPNLIDVDAGAVADTFALVPDPGVLDPRGANPLLANTQVPYGGRITLQLEELSRQAFSDRKHRRHHFEFETEMIGNPGEPNTMLRIIPVIPEEGIYTFMKPITDITRLTLRFFGPDEPLRFPVDTVYGMRFEVSPGGANLPPLGTLVVTGPTQAGDGSPINFLSLLTPGDRIYFEGVEFDHAAAPFAGAGMAVSQLEAYLNKPDGLFVGDFGKYADLSATQFTTDPLVSGLALAPGVLPVAPGSKPVLRIAKNRVRLTVRIQHMVRCDSS